MSCFIVDWLSARATLGVMAFFMFLVTQMIRVNLYIALVAFNDKGGENGTEQFTQEIIWNENANSLILGAFYWTYWATELPGGLLAQRYGGKTVLGLGVILAAIANLLLPVACKYHYLVASFLRAVQGLALGVTWPVIHWLSGRWIPQTERSKFMTSYHGAAIGSAISYPLSGIIITHYGWEFVFYFVGVITIIWSFMWWILVFDSPKEHPRLSDKENKYLTETVGDKVTTNKFEEIKTPWRNIIYSKPFWAVLIASQGLMWGTITLSMQTPAYFHQVHQLNIKSEIVIFISLYQKTGSLCRRNISRRLQNIMAGNLKIHSQNVCWEADFQNATCISKFITTRNATGFLSGIPEVGKFLFALLFSAMIDKLITKNIISVTAARKFAVGVSEYIPANFLILLGLFGSNDTVLATVMLTFISLVGGGSSSGSLANIVDLSPNHAGTLLGIIKTLTIIPGILSPVIVTYFTSQSLESKEAQWRNTFFFLAAIYIICSTVFLLFGSGTVQPWDQNKVTTKEESAFLEKKNEKERNEKGSPSENC